MDPLKTAYVKIWNHVVGAVSWDDGQGCAVFEYEPAFFSKGWDLSPVHMGLSSARKGEHQFFFPHIDFHTFHGLPGLLASALPDDFGNTIIDSWLAGNGRDPRSFNPVERLCYVGTRGMGALEFFPQIRPRQLNKSVPIEIEKIMQLAQDALSKRSALDAQMQGSDKEKAEAMLDILRVGTTAGGAVPKAIIAMNEKGHVISGQSNVPKGYDHWIMKFDGISIQQPDNFGKSREDCRVEYAYYLMAQSAGINMTPCRLLKENGRAHFMTKRFDRLDGDKIHVLSLACMGHLGWNPVGRANYEDAFRIMRILRLPYAEQAQQYRRMVFNAVTKNIDDHTKNISYMMDKTGVWKLCPAYDITFTYDPDELFGDRHKMKINGKQAGFIIDDFLQVADNMGVNKPTEIIEQVLDAASSWPDFAKQAEVKPDVIDFIQSAIKPTF